MAKTLSNPMLDRVSHSRGTLKAVAENWSHSHGVNPDGEIICVPCMAEFLLDINDLVYKDYARTRNGELIMGES